MIHSAPAQQSNSPVRRSYGAAGFALRVSARWQILADNAGRFSNYFSRVVLLLLLPTSVFFSGCVFDPGYPLAKPSRVPPELRPLNYTVKKGDTMFSIAWRYHLDYKKLARYNAISPPYTIYPGQQLRLPEFAHQTAVIHQPVPKKSTKKPQAVSNKTTTISKPVAKKKPVKTHVGWQWPAKGKVVRGFTTTGTAHNGIDIGGAIGEPVRVSAPGKVVYAGGGLAGYGKLIIVKHAGGYLSAYGHNSRILVKEGQQVTTGDRIANIGDTGTDKPKLHFEVRRNGKPLDPLRLLPPR